MPIVQTYHDDFGDNSKEEYLKRQLLEKIAAAKFQENPEDDDDEDSIISDIDISSDDETSTQKLVADERGNKLALYEKLVDRTRDIPLEKVLFCAEGCSLFDDLCLRVDVNQRYASLLPQWKDVAHLLEIDSLRTKWVETCVRPKEGLTKAMLEMYMQDGGTLGEVLQALLQLQCLDILEAIRPKVEKFLEERDRYKDTTSPSSQSQIHENFFSVIKTLILALGQADPCLDMKQYANGLKPILSKCSTADNIVSNPVEHQVLIQTGSIDAPNYSAPTANISNLSHPYNSKLHNQSKDAKSLLDPSLTELEKTKIGGCEKLTCRILLLFSQDGTEYASQAVELAKAVNHEEVTLDMLRLNEVSLWYEVLTNPEACCLKWSYEADYIVPVLTPKFLHEIHGEGVDSDDDGLLPTAPILNRYMYTLARTQYTQSGCKNLKVRPVIPPEVLREVRTSNAVKIDPLLNSSWVPLNEERFVPRIRGMLNEYMRRINKICENE